MTYFHTFRFFIDPKPLPPPPPPPSPSSLPTCPNEIKNTSPIVILTIEVYCHWTDVWFLNCLCGYWTHLKKTKNCWLNPYAGLFWHMATMSFPETARCAPDLSVHCLIQWFYCRRSLHLCARDPFGLLVKTDRDVSGRGIMVVKLLLCFVFCLTYSWYNYTLEGP